jgi:hypothetical protein
MLGTVRQRHCASCDRQVHNFAAMTPREIERLVAETGGHLCARLTRREDGSLVMLEPAKRAPHRLNLAVTAALALLPATVCAQTSPTGAPESVFSLTGTVRDIQGALISGSSLTVFHGNNRVVDAKTDAVGRFDLSLPAGEYELRATAAGFSHFSAPISAAIGNAAVADITLRPSAEFNVQVTTSAPVTDATTGGEIAISYGPWYRRLEFHLRHPILYLKHLFHHY